MVIRVDAGFRPNTPRGFTLYNDAPTLKIRTSIVMVVAEFQYASVGGVVLNVFSVIWAVSHRLSILLKE
jgi:hypothetical protein